MCKAGLKISNLDIFERLRSGEVVPMKDPEFAKIHDAVNETIALRTQLNDAQDVDTVRKILSKIIGESIDASTTVFPPFYTNIGRNIKLGKNVFINHACSLDYGQEFLQFTSPTTL